MKGIIFNLVESVVIAELGVDAWDDVIDNAGVVGAYTSLGTYPDSELLDIAAVVGGRLGADTGDVMRHVGQQSISRLYERYPDFFTPHVEVFSFLLTLDSIIHPEVLKLYPGAIVPEFDFDLIDDKTLDLVYRSARQRCDFAEGLILGAAEHYGSTVTLSQPRCTLRGDASCLIRVQLHE